MTFEEELKTVDNPAIRIIADYLLTRDDIQENLKKPNKSLKKMYEYITSQARKKALNGCAMLSDEEVFGMAVHYYDEDDLDVDKKVEEAKPEMVRHKVEVKAEPKKTEKPKKKKEVIEDEQLSLF